MSHLNRIALPVVVVLHLLAFYALDRWARPVRPLYAPVREALSVYLIPSPLAKLKTPKSVPVPEKGSARSGKSETAGASRLARLKSAERPAQAPDSAAPTAQTSGESKLQLNDPAALVKAYSDEESKSDLQKAIESHGGTVALVKKSKYEKFREAEEDASVPNCLAADGLKLNPPHVGPIALGGILALPFLADAALTGKCK